MTSHRDKDIIPHAPAFVNSLIPINILIFYFVGIGIEKKVDFRLRGMISAGGDFSINRLYSLVAPPRQVAYAP